MKETPLMIYKKVLENRLARKKEELTEIESQAEGLATAVDKRKFIELKAAVNELEICIDMADAMAKMEE
ncbi:hypothetical protein G7050_02795 [Dysgonomonas sp. HDW5A]|uniref:hypothetical protein n=1 Tax=Dysgonomonas sp. HDW5A TaxID=2714926 RepID=UPI00140CC5F2|nr:hypothetical protein [Dysgonomonas sp. HDW5A]QIK58826.1 hypothetical protein G7050_02795 [Dysgonomonas sp. HDW5A]